MARGGKISIIRGNLVDVVDDEIYPSEIHFGPLIEKIVRTNEKYSNFILPGLVDAHIHIESTMLCPSRFCEATIPHGTVSAICDPHEMANVGGLNGIFYMLRDLPAYSKIRYMAPSSVPSTSFETSGAKLGPKQVESLLRRKEIIGLGEVMNYPAVLSGEKLVMKKIGAAKELGKSIDGHAPMLSGEDLRRYIVAGITTDHETISVDEGREKLKAGMKLMLRQGSTEQNLRNLVKLAKEFPEDCFIVSDDIHVKDLVKGHIDVLLKTAVGLGLDPITAVKCCTINPARHYGLPTGTIEVGRPADFVVVNDLVKFRVRQVWIDGKKMAENGKFLGKVRPRKFPLKIKKYPITEDNFLIKAEGEKVKARVITVLPGQVITKSGIEYLKVKRGIVQPDKRRRVAYLAVVNRYRRAPVAKALVKGLYVDGAMASSVAHDSHNIIVAGNNPTDMCEATRAVMRAGGIKLSKMAKVQGVDLPIAGLMSQEKATKLASSFTKLELANNKNGNIESQFMQLSFLSLLVLPELRLSDRGLFDSKEFKFVKLFV